MWAAIFRRALVVPTLGAVAGGIRRQFGIQLRVEAQDEALVRRCDFFEQHTRLARVTHASEAADLLHHRAPDLETGDVELPIRRIHGCVERGEVEVAREAHHRSHGAATCSRRCVRWRFQIATPGMRPVAAEHTEEFRPVVADVDEFIIHRPHPRTDEPGLRHAAGIHRMRQPGQRLGDRLGILLLRRNRRQMAVEVMVADEVQRRGRHVIALLIARGDETRLWMHADKRLA